MSFHSLYIFQFDELNELFPMWNRNTITHWRKTAVTQLDAITVLQKTETAKSSWFYRVIIKTGSKGRTHGSMSNLQQA